MNYQSRSRVPAKKKWRDRLLHAEGKTTWVLIWDNVSWHTSAAVRTWIRAHNQRAKRTGGASASSSAACPRRARGSTRSSRAGCTANARLSSRRANSPPGNSPNGSVTIMAVNTCPIYQNTSLDPALGQSSETKRPMGKDGAEEHRAIDLLSLDLGCADLVQNGPDIGKRGKDPVCARKIKTSRILVRNSNTTHAGGFRRLYPARCIF